VCPAGALALERLTQRRVGFEEVVVDERRRLVENVGRFHTHRLP